VSNGQYRLEAFGFQSAWNLWRIAKGGLDEPEIELNHLTRAQRRREMDHLYESDFASRADLMLAIKIFPKVRQHLDPYNSTRMTPKPPLVIR
jgi:hypothetical protein